MSDVADRYADDLAPDRIYQSRIAAPRECRVIDLKLVGIEQPNQRGCNF